MTFYDLFVLLIIYICRFEMNYDNFINTLKTIYYDAKFTFFKEKLQKSSIFFKCLVCSFCEH
ncbi:hypothetical protein CHRYSEO8AT_520097 [Chryseobacterium sp. 8AT]|nr:hypothetical protein CHRYSEO8AT_520097 [Chryseobacterium sp. 8AT]